MAYNIGLLDFSEYKICQNGIKSCLIVNFIIIRS